jgi:hypothetical protein
MGEGRLRWADAATLISRRATSRIVTISAAACSTHFAFRIVGSGANYDVSTGLRSMMIGCLPQRGPIWLNPELVETAGSSIGPLVPTPGRVADIVR